MSRAQLAAFSDDFQGTSLDSFVHLRAAMRYTRNVANVPECGPLRGERILAFLIAYYKAYFRAGAFFRVEVKLCEIYDRLKAELQAKFPDSWSKSFWKMSGLP